MVRKLFILSVFVASCAAAGTGGRLNATHNLSPGHHPDDGHNHTVRDVSATASASSDNGPVPSILPPFGFHMTLPPSGASASASASSSDGPVPSSVLPAFPFASGGSSGASAGASASASSAAGPAELSGAGVVVTSGPQSSPLEPFCSCVLKGNCAGREAYTRQFDAVSHLQCGGEFERCCYPCPYPGMVDNFAHVIPCSPIETCNRYYGQEPTDVAQFGVLGPCPGMGTVRCVDYVSYTQAHQTISQDVHVDVTAEATPPPAPLLQPVVAPVVTFVPHVPVVAPVVSYEPVHVPVHLPVPAPVAVPVPVAPVVDNINAFLGPQVASQGNAAVSAHSVAGPQIANSFAAVANTALNGGQQAAAFSQVYPPSLWYRWGNMKQQLSFADLFKPWKKLKKMFFPFFK